MRNDMYLETARSLLRAVNRPARTLEALRSGSNHYVFSACTEAGEALIIKFPRVRETEKKYQTGQTDTLFGGTLSLAREAYLFDAVRAGGLPAPEVIGVYDTNAGPCMIVSRSPGQSLPDYMAARGHSLRDFLAVMASLGRDFSRLHTLRYPSFGNLMVNGVIEPAGLTNFADRYLQINERLMAICRDKGGLSADEHARVKAFFDARFTVWREALSIDNAPATLVITDMHGNNFFVENGVCSGYFDVESTQTAPAEFELYALRFFVFNFYGEDEHALAERAFWTAYSGGRADAPSPAADKLLDFFSACRLMELFQSYWGVRDGLRDTWGQQIKEVLFRYMETDAVDYHRLGVLWRARDKQPPHALKP